ncbi:hypothetical protein UA08_05526 [Talaromyces atroroseus]|uniref:Rhodopsin domain-containing protein n=1 Tax=Talaromyces atroroseus TaxID=1441469 RepID=A0A225AEI5_TALAT|nr:hypothetical protein UA08_05526 [Talaromyces atroroseus]OKL58950.1 hypothetical protein UA08_05526 [Talaromyces atroroseus]
MSAFDTNVDFNQSRGREINVIGWVFTGIAMGAVGLKLFHRGHMSKNLGWDDFFIFLSLSFSIIATAFVSYAATLGLGRHTAAVVADYGMGRYSEAAKWQIIAFPFNIGSFSFPNISIAILINHILGPNKYRQIALYIMSTFQVIFAMISAILVFVQCKPSKMLWDPTVGGTCWNADIFDDFTYWVSAYTATTDAILAFVPINVFRKLQMPASTKWSVCIMMGLTLLSAIVTIVKATYLHLFTNHTDPLYDVVPLVLWGLIEQNVVIVAACIPTLRPLFREVFADYGTHTHSNSIIKHGLNAILGHASHAASESAIPLDQPKACIDKDSNNTSQIWRTRENFKHITQIGIVRVLGPAEPNDQG